ncbi:MAG: phosphatase PAP2 family protein [Clostridia bacterium]|nr:phosphatase PAP2 family protein [Clostridia bacterium]
MKTKTKYILPAASGLLFLILILLLKTVDVQKTGVGDTEIGLFHLNNAVHQLFGVNMAWYKITQATGLISLAAGGAFALIGVFQLIKRKSLFKVDRDLINLGCLYILTGSIYMFFEKVIINYRPLIMEGETAPEASFPSSHTVLVLVIMGSIIMLLKKYIKNQNLIYVLGALCAAIAVITVIGRLICGVHWFTDILGGVILSVCLLSFFYALVEQ